MTMCRTRQHGGMGIHLAIDGGQRDDMAWVRVSDLRGMKRNDSMKDFSHESSELMISTNKEPIHV